MPVRTVDAATANIWIKGGSAVLVDVREPAEYRAAHIPQARLIPLSEVDADKMPVAKKIVVHCAKGGRGQTACQKLLKQTRLSKSSILRAGSRVGQQLAYPLNGQCKACFTHQVAAAHPNTVSFPDTSGWQPSGPSAWPDLSACRRGAE